MKKLCQECKLPLNHGIFMKKWCSRACYGIRHRKIKNREPPEVKKISLPPIPCTIKLKAVGPPPPPPPRVFEMVMEFADGHKYVKPLKSGTSQKADKEGFAFADLWVEEQERFPGDVPPCLDLVSVEVRLHREVVRSSMGYGKIAVCYNMKEKEEG